MNKKKVITVEDSAMETPKTPKKRVRKAAATDVTVIQQESSKKMLERVMTSDGSINMSLIPKERLTYYHEIAKSLDSRDLNTINSFGSELQNAMSHYSNDFLNQSFGNSNNNESAKLISNLLGELEQVDINDLTPSKFKKLMRKIPILRKLVTSVDQIKAKYNTIEKNIDGIVAKLEAAKQIAIRDNNLLQSQFEANSDYVDQLRDLILAGKIKSQELGDIINEMIQNRSEYEDYEIMDAQDYKSSLDKRLSDLLVLKQAFEQSLTQIKIIQRTNLMDVENTSSQIGMTIPLWKNQLSLAAALDNQKASIETKKKVTDVTNQLLLKNSEMLKTQSIEVEEANQRTVIDVETLKTTTNNLIATIEGIRKVQQEGAAKRLAAEKEIAKLGQQLEQASLGVATSAQKVIAKELLDDQGRRKLLEK